MEQPVNECFLFKALTVIGVSGALFLWWLSYADIDPLLALTLSMIANVLVVLGMSGSFGWASTRLFRRSEVSGGELAAFIGAILGCIAMFTLGTQV